MTMTDQIQIAHDWQDIRSNVAVCIAEKLESFKIRHGKFTVIFDNKTVTKPQTI